MGFSEFPTRLRLKVRYWRLSLAMRFNHVLKTGLAACVIGMLHTTKTLRLEETELFELLSAAADFREGVEHVVFGTYKVLVRVFVLFFP